MKILSSNINKEGSYENDDLICYCFQYKKKDIESDFKNNGYSKILKKIIAEKKSNGCKCKEKNPKAR
jgi:hypothetical protein